MNWETFRILQVHKQIETLKDQRREIFASVAYPKALEFKAAVVQTSGAVGDEVLEYIVKAEEIDRKIAELEEENRALHEKITNCLPYLTAREREVVLLRFYDYKGWPEIAKKAYGEITRANIEKARRIKKNAVLKIGQILDSSDTLTKDTTL